MRRLFLVGLALVGVAACWRADPPPVSVPPAPDATSRTCSEATFDLHDGACLRVCAATAPERWPGCRPIVDQLVARGMTCPTEHPRGCLWLAPVVGARSTGGPVAFRVSLPENAGVTTSWHGEIADRAGRVVPGSTCAIVSVSGGIGLCEPLQPPGPPLHANLYVRLHPPKPTSSAPPPPRQAPPAKPTCSDTAPDFWSGCKPIVDRLVAQGMVCPTGHPRGCYARPTTAHVRTRLIQRTTLPNDDVVLAVTFPPQLAVTTSWQCAAVDGAHHLVTGFACTITNVSPGVATCELRQTSAASAVAPEVMLHPPIGAQAPPAPGVPPPLLAPVGGVEMHPNGDITITVSIGTNDGVAPSWTGDIANAAGHIAAGSAVSVVRVDATSTRLETTAAWNVILAYRYVLLHP